MSSAEDAPRPSGEWSLSTLVDELLLCIIDQIDSHETLCNLAATCSRFQGLVEPYCWRSLLVRKGRHASRIALGLNNRVERIGFVQDLAVRYNDLHEEGIENLGGFMENMGKLKNLTIESPCPNNGEYRGGQRFESWTRIDYTTLFERGNLPMLTSFTLHGHPSESRKFTFGKTAIIFLHPTLRHISISCCNFNSSLKSSSIHPSILRSTALQSLTLIECNVWVPFLALILSLPKALKELSIGERLHLFDHDLPSLVPEDRTSHPGFLDALAVQRDSLERLTHIAGDLRYLGTAAPNYESGTKMRESLASLTYLEVGVESPLFNYLNFGGCPDGLQTLKVSDHALVPSPTPTLEHMTLMLKLSDRAASFFSKPAHLDIRFCHNVFAIPQNDLETIWTPPVQHANRALVYKLAKTLKTQGGRLRLFGEVFRGGKAFIPPYMYGEEQPIEALLYDSEDFYTFLGINHGGYDEELLEKPEEVEEFVRVRGGLPENEFDSQMVVLQHLAGLHAAAQPPG